MVDVSKSKQSTNVEDHTPGARTGIQKWWDDINSSFARYLDVGEFPKSIRKYLPIPDPDMAFIDEISKQLGNPTLKIDEKLIKPNLTKKEVLDMYIEDALGYLDVDEKGVYVPHTRTRERATEVAKDRLYVETRINDILKRPQRQYADRPLAPDSRPAPVPLNPPAYDETWLEKHRPAEARRNQAARKRHEH